MGVKAARATITPPFPRHRSVAKKVRCDTVWGCGMCCVSTILPLPFFLPRVRQLMSCASRRFWKRLHARPLAALAALVPISLSQPSPFSPRTHPQIHPNCRARRRGQPACRRTANLSITKQDTSCSPRLPTSAQHGLSSCVTVEKPVPAGPNAPITHTTPQNPRRTPCSQWEGVRRGKHSTNRAHRRRPGCS